MNRTEHLLTCLMEECAEIQKEAAKALRFGLDDHAPGSSVTNRENIAHEVIDLMAVMEMLEESGIVPHLDKPELLQAKKDKVEEYMRYAQEQGTLSIQSE